MVITRSP